MPYSIEKDSENIVTVTFIDSVDLTERKAAVNDSFNYIDSSHRALLLIDVRDVVVNMSHDEQKEFGTFLAHQPELSNAKVGVLHKPGHNPNQVINTYAYMEGYHVVGFDELNHARLWLKGDIA